MFVEIKNYLLVVVETKNNFLSKLDQKPFNLIYYNGEEQLDRSQYKLPANSNPNISYIISQKAP